MNFGFKKNILLTSTLVAGILMAIIIATSVYVARERNQRDGEQLARVTAQNIASNVERRLLHVYNVSRANQRVMESILSAGTQTNNRDWLDEMAKAHLQANPNMLGASIFLEPNVLDGRDAEFANTPGYSETGRYVKWWNRGEGKIESEILEIVDSDSTYTWYTRPKSTGKPYASPISEETLSSGKKVKVLSFNLPIMAKGKFMGVASSDYLLETLIEDIRAQRPFGQGSVSLLTQENKYVAADHEDWIGQDAPPLPDFVRQKLSAGEMVLLYDGEHGYSSPEDGDDVNVFAPIVLGDGSYWIAVLRFPQAFLFEASAEMMRVGVILEVVGLVILVVVLLIALTRVLKPLNNLERELSKLAGGGGDLTRCLPVSKTRDEISHISEAFNQFIGTLNGLLHKVKNNSHTMNAQSKAVEEAAALVAKGAHVQLEAASSATASVEQLAVSISSVAQRMQKAAGVSTEVRSVTEKVSEAAVTSASQVSQTLEAFQDIGIKIKSLDESSQKITDIVNAITDIAEQTNLLALNAAIEAARAGEAGRGFAVVADAVRDLATRSAQSTDEITHVLSSVRREVEAALSSMENASDQVRQGAKLAGEAADGAATIRERIVELSDELQEVDRASQEQAIETQEIARNVEQISLMAGETDVHLQQANSRLLELNASVHDTAVLLENFRTNER